MTAKRGIVFPDATLVAYSIIFGFGAGYLAPKEWRPATVFAVVGIIMAIMRAVGAVIEEMRSQAECVDCRKERER